MPSLRPQEIVDAVLDAIAQSGEAGAFIPSSPAHPRRFAVDGPGGPTLLWVYAWTLTPGGRPRLANEYRIQMTGVRSPLPINSDGPTLLLGYEPSLGVFAGFDVSLHRTFTTGSPSVQIDVVSLRQALQDGLAFHRKSNNEIAVAVRPDQLLAYARNAEALHRGGRQPATFRALSRVSSLQPVSAAALEALGTKRRRLVSVVARLSRDANFAAQVLAAYGNRCAVTRMQLRLVEAAHILPVAAPNSPDNIVNGIALSPTYHRAFDSGLIYLDENRVMTVNPRREHLLSGLTLTGGLEALRASLGRIHLPADRQQWPDPRLIRRANTYRRIEI
jgi:putative restriction endonuclease